MRKFLAILIVFVLLLLTLCAMVMPSFAQSSDNYVEYGSNPVEILPLTRTTIDDSIIQKVQMTLNTLDNISGKNQLRSTDEMVINEYNLKRDVLRNITYWEIETTDYDIDVNADNNTIEGIYNNKENASLAETTNEENAKNIAQTLYDNLDFPKEYELSYAKEIDDNTWEINFQMKYDNTYNPYESVKMFLNPTSREIISLSKFSEKPIEIEDSISIETIKENVEKYNEEINKKLFDKINKEYSCKIEIDTAELTYTKPNTFFESNITDEAELQEVRKAWKINCSQNLIIYIDAESGEIIRGDYSRYEEAQAQNANYFPQYDGDCTESARIGFQKLGYSTSTAGASDSEIRSWISDSTGAHYGYFIVTHGGNTNGNLHFVSSTGTPFFPSDVRGNWHLVFIDACNSKDNNQFAQAFKITGYSNRAYLGWYGSVNAGPDTQFQKYFWENEVTTSTIQQAAKDAASQVPGSGTTPIRFSGDTSWWGYAS